jgi:uncharacterized protein YbcC (UPF0753/DUF2309 family)
MNAVPAVPVHAVDLEAAIGSACRAIAPSWPLDRQIAVNPWWGFVHLPFTEATARQQQLLGAKTTLSRAEYRRAWHAGEITRAAVARALREHGADLTVEAAVAALEQPDASDPGLPLPSDVIDAQAASGRAPAWRETITQQVSQFCASYFDQHQADWHRTRDLGLFATWHSVLEHDHALEPLMHAPEIRARAAELPTAPDAAIGWALDRLGVPEAEIEEFLRVCLLRIMGWASWCAYLGWEASLRGTTDPHLRELLAIRVSWEGLLVDDRADGHAAAAWRETWAFARRRATAPGAAVATVWQRAHEIAYQDGLVAQLERTTAGPAARPRPGAQLVFCIDVRSERFRRALEAVDPALSTHGFAGFFGLPLNYTPLGAQDGSPRLPGLLAPALEATDTTGDPATDARIAGARADERRNEKARQAFVRTPTGAFPLVELLGLGYAVPMLRRALGRERAPAAGGTGALRPALRGAGAAAAERRADLVAGTLRAMSLTRGFARLLVLVGHGSQTDNNPQAAALDCGACGGHAGDVNARVLAGLINDPAVRAALVGRGIVLPDDTLAVAALHDTTTDEITLFDADVTAASHGDDLAALRGTIRVAADRVRAERAPSLGLERLAGRPAALLRALRARAADWAETRPEWGLADNAAFIVAPRERTRGLDLRGRTFLHDYSADDDRDGSILELIMTAPMVVAHWINLQYYASTVDPDRFGSGNKVLHNVACGRIGVFEGNTGDLRIGLARQSVSDGVRLMHAPLRLSVVIDGPAARIEEILDRHATVRGLVDNAWLHLFRFDDDRIVRYDSGTWSPWSQTAGG